MLLLDKPSIREAQRAQSPSPPAPRGGGAVGARGAALSAGPRRRTGVPLPCHAPAAGRGGLGRAALAAPLRPHARFIIPRDSTSSCTTTPAKAESPPHPRRIAPRITHAKHPPACTHAPSRRYGAGPLAGAPRTAALCGDIGDGAPRSGAQRVRRACWRIGQNSSLSDDASSPSSPTAASAASPPPRASAPPTPSAGPRPSRSTAGAGAAPPSLAGLSLLSLCARLASLSRRRGVPACGVEGQPRRATAGGGRRAQPRAAWRESTRRTRRRPAQGGAGLYRRPP